MNTVLNMNKVNPEPDEATPLTTNSMGVLEGRSVETGNKCKTIALIAATGVFSAMAIVSGNYIGSLENPEEEAGTMAHTIAVVGLFVGAIGISASVISCVWINSKNCVDQRGYQDSNLRIIT